jgi:DNA-binding MarR family transcriptional regulator
MSRGLKARATADLLDEARGLSGDFDKLSQAVSEQVGLSSTELLAMDLISRNGKLTAGQLARELHLTTGAITGLVDRLERAGFARRASDPTDRRRVMVTATAQEARVGELYRPLAANLRRAIEGYSERDLATLTEFIRRLRSVVAGTAESIRAESTE